MFAKSGVCRYCGATLKSRKSLSGATIKLIGSHAKNGGRVDGSEPMAKVLFVPNLSNWGEIRSHQLDHKRRWSADLVESCNFCNHCKGSGDYRYFHGKEEKIAHLEEMSALAREFYLRGNLKCDSLAINNFISCIHDELSEVRSHS